MRSRLIVFAAFTLVAASTVVAHAQVVLYGTLNFTHPSNVPTGAVLQNGGMYQEQYDSFTTTGIGGGVTINFLPVPVISLGFDLRGSTRSGTVGTDTGLAGLKLGAKLPVVHLKPYIEAAGGYMATRTVNISTNPSGTGTVGGTFTNKYAVYEILGGIDYPLLKHFVDFRVIEIGAGSSVGTSPNINFVTVNTGLTLHF